MALISVTADVKCASIAERALTYLYVTEMWTESADPVLGVTGPSERLLSSLFR